jgi:inhibitor of cysteine peptidase
MKQRIGFQILFLSEATGIKQTSTILKKIFQRRFLMLKTIILKKITCVLLVLLFPTLAISGCMPAGKTYTSADSGESINLKLNETIKIKLESNPTTGYNWNLSDKTNTAIISLLSSDYKTSSSGKEVVGAGGYETITFKAIAKGNTTITLTYNKSWEEGVEPIETFELNVAVD